MGRKEDRELRLQLLICMLLPLKGIILWPLAVLLPIRRFEMME